MKKIHTLESLARVWQWNLERKWWFAQRKTHGGPSYDTLILYVVEDINER